MGHESGGAALEGSACRLDRLSDRPRQCHLGTILPAASECLIELVLSLAAEVADRLRDLLADALEDARECGREQIDGARRETDQQFGQERRAADEVQKLTDKFVAEVEKALEGKEKDLMAV